MRLIISKYERLPLQSIIMESPEYFNVQPLNGVFKTKHFQLVSRPLKSIRQDNA